MNETSFAQVAVENTVYHFDKLFTYRVPLSLREQLKPGVRVSVPFGSGNRKRVGLVFSLSSQGEGEKTKDVESCPGPGAGPFSQHAGSGPLDEGAVLLHFF